MDLVLQICDDFVLDSAWARIVPLKAFAASTSFQNGSYPIVAESLSKWDHLVSHLPHPPLAEISESMNICDVPAISAWPRNYIPRQIASLSVLTLTGIHILYFLFAWLSYAFIFNHDMMRHPRFLKNQVKMEILTSLRAFPGMALLTLPWFQAEVMGYSKLYAETSTYGWWYLPTSVILYLVFTDYCIYWLHRWLHIPAIYKFIHKPHHKWIIPTPFASHAFHPVDGYIQSLPYHAFVFIFPLHRVLYLVLFVLVNFWTILIHDSDMVTGHPLENIINGPAHHTLHHLYFNVNYGQYFTWADRFSNSYRHPESSLDPLLEVQMADKEKAKKDQ